MHEHLPPKKNLAQNFKAHLIHQITLSSETEISGNCLQLKSFLPACAVKSNSKLV